MIMGECNVLFSINRNKYSFQTHTDFTKVEHVAGYRASLHKYQRTRFFQTLFSDQNVKLKSKSVAKVPYLEISNLRIIKYVKQDNNKNVLIENLWHAAKGICGEFYSLKCIC